MCIRDSIGIERNLNVGENFTVGGGSTVADLRVTGVSTFVGLMNINGGAEIGDFKVGIVTANMLGTTSGNIIIDSLGGTTTIQDNLVVSGDFTSLGATNGNIRIGVTNDNEIDTSSGALTIDSAGGTVTVDDQLNVTGVSTFVQVHVDNIRINSNEIDTTTGNLTIDSAGGTVTVDDDLTVTGDLSISGDVNGSTVTFTGDITAASGIFGNIRIAPGTDNNEIDTTTGNLILDSTGGTVEVNDNLTVSGTGTFTGDVIAFSSSDLTLKENLVRIDRAVERVNKLSGYTFDWKSDAGLSGESYDHLKGQSDIGVIAQEVEALGLVGLTTTRPDGIKAVRYDRLVPVLIQAIKELDARVKSLGG